MGGIEIRLDRQYSKVGGIKIHFVQPDRRLCPMDVKLRYPLKRAASAGAAITQVLERLDVRVPRTVHPIHTFPFGFVWVPTPQEVISLVVSVF